MRRKWLQPRPSNNPRPADLAKARPTRVGSVRLLWSVLVLASGLSFGDDRTARAGTGQPAKPTEGLESWKVDSAAIRSCRQGLWSDDARRGCQAPARSGPRGRTSLGRAMA